MEEHCLDDLKLFYPQQVTSSVDTITDYILRKNLTYGRLYGFINAVQIVYKAIACKIGRYNLAGVGKATFIDKKRPAPCEATAKIFEKHLEDLFINVIGDTGIVDCMISNHTEKIIKVEQRVPGNYMLAFNILDSRDNLNDNLPVGSIFGLYKLNPEKDFELEDLSGNTIVTAGFALHGTCAKLVLAFGDNQGVHTFHLDQSLGEFFLWEPNKQIAKRGTCYSVNEGITSGWDEATKIFINRKKNPRCNQNGDSFYIGSFTADVARIIQKGGIFMDPSNVKYPSGKLHLISECSPMAYILRQAGGFASDGYLNILDIEPHNEHQQTPFFGGSIEDVLGLMELKTIYKAKDYN